MDVMSVYIVSLCRDTSVWTYPCKVSVLVRIVTSVHVLQDSVENYITDFSKANKKNLIELNFSRREAHIGVSGFIYMVLNFFFEQPWNNKMQIINIFPYQIDYLNIPWPCPNHVYPLFWGFYSVWYSFFFSEKWNHNFGNVVNVW